MKGQGNSHGQTPRYWYSDNVQALEEWMSAREKILAKTPLELSAAKAELRSSTALEGERKPVFGDGTQDYMMQRYKNLAVIQISGNLVKSDSFWNRYYGQVSYDEIRRSVIMALRDNTVQGIVACMATPGGSASGADAMATFFSKADQAKPFYSFAETDMCSGGYYLGAPSREIYAQRAALVGSIGVLMVHMDILGMYKDMGITPTVFRAGEFKALGTPYEHLDKRAKENIQGTLNSFFNMFNEHVVANRSAFSNVEELLAEAGEGRVFMAEQAKEVGLVDQVAEMEDAFEEISDKVRSSSGSRISVPATKVTRGSNMGVKRSAPTPTLSEEQLAILAGGGTLPGADDPETPDPQVEGDEVETTETPVEPKVESQPADDKPETPPAPETVASAPAAPAVVDVEKLLQISTDLGQARADLKLAEKDNLDLKAQLSAQKTTIDSLREIVAVAIGNRQIALGYQPNDVSALTADQQIELFQKLDTDFKARFQAGPKSRPSQAPVKPVTNTPVADAARSMTGKL